MEAFLAEAGLARTIKITVIHALSLYIFIEHLLCARQLEYSNEQNTPKTHPTGSMLW